MATANSQAASTAASTTEPAQTDFPLTLEEWCVRKSSGDKRVELIGGFYHSEKVAGHLKDTHASFEAAFVAFANRPVK